MKSELFKQAYTGYLVEIAAKFAENEAQELADILKNGSHHQILKAKHRIDDLAKARMMVEAYKLIED